MCEFVDCHMFGLLGYDFCTGATEPNNYHGCRGEIVDSMIYQSYKNFSSGIEGSKCLCNISFFFLTETNFSLI